MGQGRYKRSNLLDKGLSPGQALYICIIVLWTRYIYVNLRILGGPGTVMDFGTGTGAGHTI